MSTSGLVGLGVTVVLVGAVVYFAAAEIQVGALNLLGGTRVETDIELPWVDADRKARVYSIRSFSFNNGITERWEWGAGRWRTQDPDEIVSAALLYLERVRVLEDWPETGGVAEFYGGNRAGVPAGIYPVRVAPYRFHLVSIRPTVILMQADPAMVEMAQAHALEPTGSRFSQWLASLPHLQYLSAWQISNPIQVGTHLPAGTGWQWFSPDMQQPPTPVSLATTPVPAIPIPGGRLTFHPAESGWRVHRE